MDRFLSVIIPTHNRPDVIRRALQSLKNQTLSHDKFAVIVVDNSSNDDSRAIADRDYPFKFTYLRLQNQGATNARNVGAQQAASEVFVFMDDDVTPAETALEKVVNVFPETSKTILMAAIETCYDGAHSPYAEVVLRMDEPLPPLRDRDKGTTLYEVDHVYCNTEFLAVKRSDFFALGMFQDPSGGWPNWDDVDFGFRAARQGYRLCLAAEVRVQHWDYSLTHLLVAAERWRRASRAAVKLFQTHPDLRNQLPMFRDKFPVQWFHDPPKLVVRKLARKLSASYPALFFMERITFLMERIHSSASILSHMYRWVHGAYMYRGVREGLQTHES